MNWIIKTIMERAKCDRELADRISDRCLIDWSESSIEAINREIDFVMDQIIEDKFHAM